MMPCSLVIKPGLNSTINPSSHTDKPSSDVATVKNSCFMVNRTENGTGLHLALEMYGKLYTQQQLPPDLQDSCLGWFWYCCIEMRTHFPARVRVLDCSYSVLYMYCTVDCFTHRRIRVDWCDGQGYDRDHSGTGTYTQVNVPLSMFHCVCVCSSN